MPPTDKQIEANRQNAQLSTGPRTEEGKRISSANAITTGLTSTRIYVAPEEQAAFESMNDNLGVELAPVGELQLSLFVSIVHANWNVLRCINLEAALQKEAISKGLLDAAFDDDFSRKLDRLFRYRRMHESTRRSAIADLRKLQTEEFRRNEANPEKQDAEPEAPSILVDTRTAPKPKPRKPQRSAACASFDDEIRSLQLAAQSFLRPGKAA